MTETLIKNIQVSCNNCSLDTICLPRGLTAQEVEKVNQVIKRKKTLQRGDYLYHEGMLFKGILAIKSGTAKLVRYDHQGNEHILNILLPGELLGFDGLSDNKHSCSAIALETLSFCELPSNELESICLRTPGLMRELFRHTGAELNKERDLNVLNKRPAEERLAAFLIGLSNRLKKRGFSPVDFTLTLTRQEIGNYLGVALETVSRLLQQFQANGLIEVNHRHIHILDQERLKKLFQQCE